MCWKPRHSALEMKRGAEDSNIYMCFTRQANYTKNLLLNFSTLNPTVGTMFAFWNITLKSDSHPTSLVQGTWFSSGLKWFKSVLFPLLSRPTTKQLHSFFLIPRTSDNLSRKPISLKENQNPANWSFYAVVHSLAKHQQKPQFIIVKTPPGLI